MASATAGGLAHNAPGQRSLRRSASAERDRQKRVDSSRYRSGGDRLLTVCRGRSRKPAGGPRIADLDRNAPRPTSSKNCRRAGLLLLRSARVGCAQSDRRILLQAFLELDHDIHGWLGIPGENQVLQERPGTVVSCLGRGCESINVAAALCVRQERSSRLHPFSGSTSVAPTGSRWPISHVGQERRP